MTTPELPRAVLIANRGEIAVRIARTCREMGIRSIAVCSEVDAGARHVLACDEAVLLGGASPSESYLCAHAIIDAATRSGADAVHPGFGFLAEDPRFAQAVLDAGLRWIGPTPAVIAAMGDKLEAKRRMAAAGVPLVPGERIADDADPEGLREVAERVGFPLMVKAVAGGGGKGMRAVHTVDELPDAVASARREAEAAFGDDRLFLERLIARSRHVEVQIVGDQHGHLLHLFERECSIQRRHQKVVEESPSPGIDDEVRDVLTGAATTAARALGYTSAGTVEFILDEEVLARRRAGEDVPATDAVAFLEVNTRLQVEHPVTEQVVGIRDPATGMLEAIDLVRWQLLIAGGWSLPVTQEQLVTRGHAIEVRLYAEDVPAGFLPATGRLHAFEPALREGIRWDAGVAQGEDVSPHYDPMLAKVIATAPTRTEAATRLAAALQDTPLVGVATNRDLLVAVLRDATFLVGDTTTAYLEERLAVLQASGVPDEGSRARACLLATLHGALQAQQGSPALPTLPVGFCNTGVLWPQETFAGPDGDDWTVRLRGRRDGSLEGQVLRDVPAGFLDADGEVLLSARVRVHTLDRDTLDAEVDGRRQRVRIVGDPQGRVQVLGPGVVDLVRRPRFPSEAAERISGANRSPMPGSVVAVAVGAGDEVAEGQLLATVEAMKMEHRVTAGRAGTVTEVRVTAGQQVAGGEVLVVVDG
ncbi:MAG: biotin carboxylase N-terminal domain-containing protein [Nitriliruptoraceae bacterium]